MGGRVFTVSFAALVLLSFLPIPAGAAKRPVARPTMRGAMQPKLLSDYERNVLQIEYAKLIREIREKRAEASADPSLSALEESVAAAKKQFGASSTNAVVAARALSDAVETILYSDEAIARKIKRFQEVGNLLEYDLRMRREQRASVRPALPSAPPEDSSQPQPER